MTVTTGRVSLDNHCGYNCIYEHVLEMPHRHSILSAEVEQIAELVCDRPWGWHFVPHNTGTVVKPAVSQQARDPQPDFNHYLCVSFKDAIDLVQVKFSVFGC